MTTANREYEALTTVEAVQKAFADGREVQRWWPAVWEWVPANAENFTDPKWIVTMFNSASKFRARAISKPADGEADSLEKIVSEMRELSDTSDEVRYGTIATQCVRAWANRIAALRAPAASVGDAPSDAVACYRMIRDGWTWPSMLDCWQDGSPSAYMLKYAADEGYRIEYAYTAPPAAPVVSEGAKIDSQAIKLLARDIHYAIADDGLAPQAPADYNALRDPILRTLNRWFAALSVPATDDKGAGYAATVGGLIESARCLGVAQQKKDPAMAEHWESEVQRYRRMLASLRLAAPTSPHDVDAVRARGVE